MSGIMYKNRPYAGGGGGGASALSDLTDTNISNPTNGQVLKYNNGFWENGNESGGTTVVANPQDAASADLEKLQVGNNIYNIPQGTNVVANPTGTPTEELSTIQIGQDIYEIVGGGGSGGGSYEYTQLYTGTTNPETMTLNDDISNYDVIYIRTANTNGYSVTALFRAQDLIDGIGQNVQFGIANDSEMFYFRVTSQTLFTRFSSNAQFPVEIGGMKFGGGGGSSITYGYTNPTGSASDGALYILLNQNNTKRGEYLYMLNEWVLIDGQPPFDGSIYDEGAEGVELGLYQATKEATYIEINNGGGYLNYYTNTVNKIDVTDFDELYCKYQFNGTEYEQTVDISSYTGEKYIMFHYFSGAGFNNCAVSITDELYTSTTFPATDVIELTRSLVENTVKTKVRKMILR